MLAKSTLPAVLLSLIARPLPIVFPGRLTCPNDDYDFILQPPETAQRDIPN